MAAKALLKTFMRPRDAEAIRADIAAVDAAEAARAQVAVEAAARRQELVLEGDVDTLEAHDAKVRRAAVEAEVAAAKRVRLVEELRAAEEAAEQGRRNKLYAVATRAAAETRKLYLEEYPRVARQLAQILSRIGELSAQIDEANAALPDGKPRISNGEPNRGRDAIPDRYEPTTRRVYVDSRSGAEVVAFRPSDTHVVVEERDGPTSLVSLAQPAVPHVPLGAEVHLPGLAYGDAPFWGRRS
ncbi:hypothetical protein [Methylobacterium sp. WSM2598]|uniref:hypothetical protein n=1 Tax=Methylobacterium sp. WSM2598 TaxID=398261 RepID=UPI00036BEC43|nr:hypothetical protein [Methylobacterium sp. WSM2598]